MRRSGVIRSKFVSAFLRALSRFFWSRLCSSCVLCLYTPGFLPKIAEMADKRSKKERVRRAATAPTWLARYIQQYGSCLRCLESGTSVLDRLHPSHQLWRRKVAERGRRGKKIKPGIKRYTADIYIYIRAVPHFAALDLNTIAPRHLDLLHPCCRFPHWCWCCWCWCCCSSSCDHRVPTNQINDPAALVEQLSIAVLALDPRSKGQEVREPLRTVFLLGQPTDFTLSRELSITAFEWVVCGEEGLHGLLPSRGPLSG